MRLPALMAILLLLAIRPAAAEEPTPIIFKADPQMVYPNTPGWLDASGRIVIVLHGTDLGPPEEGVHPTGHEGGYQHIFVRGLSPRGDRATDWVPAGPGSGVMIYGGCFRSLVTLAVDPRVFLSEPGSHMQVKLWVSRSVTSALDPAQANASASAWSAIKTIDVAPAGAVKPVPAQTASIPTITRFSPGNFTLPALGANWNIKIYGSKWSHLQTAVIFDGDKGNPVAPDKTPQAYDDDMSFLPGQEQMIHVTIPEKHRRTSPGSLSVMIFDGTNYSAPKTITFTASAAKPVERPVAPPAMNDLKPAPAATPGRLSLAAAAPAITRLSASELDLGGPAATFRIKVYGRNLGGPDTRVAFNGTPGPAPDDAPRDRDDDGGALRPNEWMVHVTIPESLRRPGQLSLALVNGVGRSEAVTLTLRPAPLVRIAPVAPPAGKVPAPTLAPIKRP